MAAALDQKPGAHGLADGPAEVDAHDRAAGAGADAAGLERDGESGSAEPLLEPRGNQAHHAGMPALGGGDDDRALVFDAERGHGFGFRLRHRGNLDHLTLAVEAVELGGKARALGWIILQEQVDPERRPPDAAAGVDPRPEQKAEMPGLGRPADPRAVHQRGESGMIAPAQRHEALGDEGAVEALERHHIGDRAERHQIEKAEKIRFRPLYAPESARSGAPD